MDCNIVGEAQLGSEGLIRHLLCSRFVLRDLTDILLKRTPARGGFQGVRGALGFLANLVRLTHEKTDIIEPGHANLDDSEVRTRFGDLEPSGDLIERCGALRRVLNVSPAHVTEPGPLTPATGVNIVNINP